MTRSLFFVPFVLVAAYAGCSSDDTTTKPATSASDAGNAASDSGGTASDAGSTASDAGSTVTDSGSTTVDAGGNAAACQSYCNCMASTCASKAPANCVATCTAATTWDLSCRTTHCGLAGSDPTTHCPHAAGEALCK